MESRSTYLVITNNPLVVECMPADLAVEYHDVTYREVLVLVRAVAGSGLEI